MYKHSSPEALSIVTLGRADSKIPDKTCRGITVAGKACRNPLKKGSKERYCHLHRDQSSTQQSRLLGAKTRETVPILGESDDDSYGYTSDKKSEPVISVSKILYPTPSPSPKPLPSLPQNRKSPVRKPVPSIAYPPQQQFRSPSLQLSPPASIPPPTPPTPTQCLSPSIVSPAIIRQQKPGFGKLSKTFRKIFQSHEPKSQQLTPVDFHTVPLETVFDSIDVALSRYPHSITPNGLPKLSQPTEPPSSLHQQELLTPHHSPKSPSIPRLQERPPTAVLALAQSRSGVERSWETMWVPGIDGLGAHIICKGSYPFWCALTN